MKKPTEDWADRRARDFYGCYLEGQSPVEVEYVLKKLAANFRALADQCNRPLGHVKR